MSKKWIPIEFDYKDLDKNKNKITKIIDGTNPAIIVRNFYDSELCKKAVYNAKEFVNFKGEDTTFKKIGVSLLSFITSKDDYFFQAAAVRNTLSYVFEGIEDPRKKIHHLFSEIFPNKTVSVATEGEKKYACGIIRFHELGDFAQIHRDCVRFEGPNFYVAELSNQLSTVLYLQQSESGGELLIYRKIWNKSDERFREINFGYSPKVIEECKESALIKPRQGDLIIINPIHFHEILPVKGNKKRITLGLFVAFSKYGNNVVTWS
ncbi:MAG: 2OG-Fe(II) oxygenase [Nitrosopumilaceae archaeon]